MNNLIDNLNKLNNELELYKREYENKLSKSQDGILIATNHKKGHQYYLKKNPKAPRKYIKKKDMNFVKELAQNEYMKKMLPEIKKQKRKVEDLIINIEANKMIEIYNKMPKGKKILVDPYRIPDEEYKIKWQEYEDKKKEAIDKQYPSKYQLKEDDGYYSEKNEHVKSKTEKMIADKLYFSGIAYVYESPILMNTGSYWRPDFKILNARTRKVFYLEHLGRMGEEDYFEDTMGKLVIYEKNGIRLGDNLLVTYESKKHQYRPKDFESLLKNHFI